MKKVLTNNRKNETKFLSEKTLTENTNPSNYIDLSEKIKNLEQTVSHLSNKITSLVDKVVLLEQQVVNLTTVNEQLMYMLENNIDDDFSMKQNEEEVSEENVKIKLTKFGLN